MSQFSQDVQWSDPVKAFGELKEAKFPFWDGYKGCYSTWLGGYFRDPWVMLLPMDDHGFHRGDGLFEAIKIQDGAFIDLDAHLLRFQRAADTIGMTHQTGKMPHSWEEIKDICLELGRRCQVNNHGLLRLFLTRGPGGFSPNPFEVIAHQFYAVIMEMKPLPSSLFENGCKTMFSTVSAKDPFYSRIKSLNYLPNVLMRKECQDKGYDMTICLTNNAGSGEESNKEPTVCEGAGENMFIVTTDKHLLVPRFDYTLPGTTIQVMMRLATELLNGENPLLSSVEFLDISKSDVLNAAEAAFVGTATGVLPIREIEGHLIGGDGKPGPVSQILHERLLAEFSNNPTLRTPFM